MGTFSTGGLRAPRTSVCPKLFFPSVLTQLTPINVIYLGQCKITINNVIDFIALGREFKVEGLMNQIYEFQEYSERNKQKSYRGEKPNNNESSHES